VIPRPVWVIGAVVALAVSVAPAQSARAKTFGGMVPDLPTGTHLSPRVSARAANLPYGGGPVLHSNRTHLIFWQPAGSKLTFAAGYESLIQRFLTGVAADSHLPTNAYGLSGQYRDAFGPAAYDSTYGGAVVDRGVLPASGCNEPPTTGPGWSICLTDAQLEDEIEQVVKADRLPTTATDVYFLVTPDGLGDCTDSASTSCALGGSATGYCGYHSQTPDGLILYAVIPYTAVPGHCESGNPRPNGSTADPTISIVSHEHNEAVTDPEDDAWIDLNGNEIGDLCVTNFGPILGGSGARAWNEVIHGGHYYLQDEWSNENFSCRPRGAWDPVSVSMPGRGQVRRSLSFTGHARDPYGSIVAYRWSFGDGAAARGRAVSHTFKRAGTYKVVLQTTDSAAYWSFYTRTIHISGGTR
jgi:PKD domain